MNFSPIQLFIGLTFPISLIGIGLFVLIRKKPFIISLKWNLLFLFAMLIIISYNSLFIPERSNLIFTFTIIVIILGYLYITRKGYLVVGANGKDFYNVLIDYLTECNYEFQLTSNSIKIKEPAVDILIDADSVSGIGKIEMKNRQNPKTFHAIIDGLRNREIKIKLTVPVCYIIAGFLLLCFVVVKLFQ